VPRNFQLIEAINLEAEAWLQGLITQFSSNSSAMANSSSPDLSRMWLVSDELQLSSTVLGSGAMGQVVAGTYAGHQVSIYCSGCSSPMMHTLHAMLHGSMQ
jgi:hypothetical protein